jgi:DNA mismatch repair ATPase MutS
MADGDAENLYRDNGRGPRSLLSEVAKASSSLVDDGAGSDSFKPFSILFLTPDQVGPQHREWPTYFRDLNLDLLMESLTADKGDYHLETFLASRLDDFPTISYRQAIFTDLENAKAYLSVTAFAQGMKTLRANVETMEKLRHPLQRQSWHLDILNLYQETVRSLAAGLDQLDLKSRGLTDLREYLHCYTTSQRFQDLLQDIAAVRARLSSIEYEIRIKGDRVSVSRYKEEPDYSSQVLDTFDRFKQGAVRDYRVKFREPVDLNHIEAQVLDRVAKLFPEEFTALARFSSTHSGDVDATLIRFDREVQFYVSYLQLQKNLQRIGLPFCYPEITMSKDTHASQSFDITLALKLIADKVEVVTNDFSFSNKERILVVSGPNQGGKTTFSRMLGQLHHLAALGCPVPGASARLHLCDEIYTHFEREEIAGTLLGKLEDDLLRLQDIFSCATSRSIVILNEVFASTTLHDALFLGKKVVETLIGLDCLTVYVTFVDELASLAPQTVSMVSSIAPDDPTRRTYKVIRRPADGLAYAMALAEKYGLTYQQLKDRVHP